MKKIVPFSKDILFNTEIFEINSISLEHTLKLEKDNIIDGDFIISGDYKESEVSIVNEPFIYNVPFSIDIDKKYQADNVKIEIDDFNYKVLEKNILSINVNVSIDGVEEVEIIEDKELERDVSKVKEEIKEVTNVFDDLSFDDNYVNYHVHIYRENDSIENIIKNYNLTKEELEEYNDLSTITIGSKLIIPSNE